MTWHTWLFLAGLGGVIVWAFLEVIFGGGDPRKGRENNSSPVVGDGWET